MQTLNIQISDVIYNAATQTFDALVTVKDTTGTVKYPCSIEAPITLPFAEAAKGLKQQAVRRHSQPAGGIYAKIASYRPAHRAPRKTFDVRGWINDMQSTIGQRIA